jgi:hypothetical protein
MNDLLNLPHCTHYDLSLAIQPEALHPAYKLYSGTIQVDCTATIENHTVAPVSAVPLMLYRLLHVDAVRDVSGEALAFSQAVVALAVLTTSFREWLWGIESSAFLAQEVEGSELVRQLSERYV